ncbi:sigma-70 family RNA polymerase sigma factor [candidate division KSB1 bacterium]|nr:sigma-70 family RNA polymerase sigma factor [candidate division KSB1 bacterium]
MNISEEELLQQAKAGDRAAQAEIVYQNERMVYNLALRLLGNSEDAENVLQETFLKVLESLDSFQGKSSISTWIYRIAANFALMRLRSRKTQVVSLEDYPVDEIKDYQGFNRALGDDPLKALLNDELKEILNSAIEQLPPKFKSVFILKDIEGLSLKEIADMLDLSLAGVKSNLHRARVFLRNQLAEYVGKNQR